MNPLLRPSSIALVMLSLSIGWGIRGNFGHQYGCMIAGALSGIAVSLCSGREDWRRRVLYFAFFGALGWAFGGTMAYMPVLGYTHSGVLTSQLYGFFVIFVTGFLWASIGGAGTAYAAVEDYDRMTALFKPLCWVLAVWTFLYFFEDPLISWYEQVRTGSLESDFRQRSPFYWLDSHWISMSAALAALCAFDLWERRFALAGRLAALALGGAALGFGVQFALSALGWLNPLLSVVVQPQGDPSAGFNTSDFITNWPRLFSDLAPHMGWILGLIAGVSVYFYLYGRFASGASLLLHIFGGSMAAFILLPVLLSLAFGWTGGFRMVSPRGDSWAMVLGALLGALRYFYRNRLKVVASAALISGAIGGLGFMLAQFVKLLALMPGNPVLTADPGVIQAWAHWRRANWHSIVAEQGVGLLYGLGIVLAMAVVSRQTPREAAAPPRRRWTEIFAAVFVLNVVTYVNLVKNTADWTKAHTVAEFLKAPLVGAIEFSARGWFTLVFVLFTVCTVALLVSHTRRRLAIVPAGWLGKGQLFFIVFLWIMTIGNFERALVSFHEQRLATEGTIFVNSLIATFLLLTAPRDEDQRPSPSAAPFPLGRLMWATAALMLVFIFGFTGVVRAVYGDKGDSWGRNIRFGPNADWRLRPLLKNVQHR